LQIIGHICTFNGDLSSKVVWGEPLNSERQTGPKESLCYMALKVFWYLELFKYGIRVWHGWMDGQTDRTIISNSNSVLFSKDSNV